MTAFIRVSTWQGFQTALRLKSQYTEKGCKNRMGKEVDMDFPGSAFKKLSVLMHLLLSLDSNYLMRIEEKIKQNITHTTTKPKQIKSKTDKNSHYCLPSYSYFNS